MRFITFAAVTTAFIASVSAKIGFGSCPTNHQRINFGEYTDEVTIGFEDDHVYNHEIIAIDKQFDSLIPLLGKFGFKIPLNIQCDDLGTIPPFSMIAQAVKEAADAADAT